MKIKKLAPIALIALLALAWYTGLSSVVGAPLEYKEYLEKAKQYEEEGRYQYAIEEYQKALEAKPKQQELYMKLINNYQKLNDDNQMLAQCEYVIQNFTDNQKAYAQELDYYMEQAKMDTAALIAQKAIKEHPDDKTMKEYYQKLKSEYMDIYASYAYISVIYNNLALIKNEEGKCGLLNGDGSLFVAPEYENISLYSVGKEGEEQMAAVEKDGEWHYINEKQYKAMINKEGYDFLGAISENCMSIAKEGKYGYAIWNKEERCFEAVTELDWDYAGTMHHGVAAVCKDGKWALINSDFQEITKYEYDEIILDEFGVCSRNDVAFVKNNEKYHLISLDGRVIGKEEFDEAKPFYTGKLTAVCKDGKWGFINKDGELKIPYSYEDAEAFSEIYAPVMKDGKWGYIDQDEELVIDYRFDGAKPFSENGVAAIKKGDEWKLIQLYIYE